MLLPVVSKFQSHSVLKGFESSRELVGIRLRTGFQQQH